MAAAVRPNCDEGDVTALCDFVGRVRRLLVLTGAGVSTASGIPDYRDGAGAWKRREPMRYQTFIGSETARRRYWARSMAGWPAVAAARPNAAHRALAELEHAGLLAGLITQNVDGLHRTAGGRSVIDLHGCLDRVVCLGCGATGCRHAFQEELARRNPAWGSRSTGVIAPDGDADLADADYAGFSVPACSACGGVLKPDVVFFGEAVPRQRVADAMTRLAAADALLVVGSSLMVYSGLRFVRAAAERDLPIAAVNRGACRGEESFTLKIERDCTRLLPALVAGLTRSPPASAGRMPTGGSGYVPV